MYRTKANEKRALLSIVTASLVLIACGSADESTMGNSGKSGSAGAGAPQQEADAGASMDAGADVAPPEQEVEFSYQSPVATGRIVWIANPQSGQVAYVDANSLEVRTIPAGNGPKYMAAVPSATGDNAVVINSLSSDLSILRAELGKVATAKTIAIAPGANSIAVSHNGKWAITWTDARLETKPSKLQGFQDITVVDLASGVGASKRLSVGFRPIAVSFASSDARAFAVTQDGISVIDLASDTPKTDRLVALSSNPLEDPGTRDVAITPDGTKALVRRDGDAILSAISLEDDSITDVTLPGPCTDLDLSNDGKKAIAVIRSTGDVAILPIDSIISDPKAYELVHVSQATVGSVSIAQASSIALLYTNAVAEDRLTQLAFATSPAVVSTIKLHAPVLSVFPSEGGNTAIVVHQDMPKVAGAFSLVSVDPVLPAKIVEAFAPIQSVAQSPDGKYAAISERSDSKKIYGVHLLRTSNQQVDHYDLASPPISVGIMTTAARAYVAQEHSEGRITFLDLETGIARTLTGFELAARVVDGSKP